MHGMVAHIVRCPSFIVLTLLAGGCGSPAQQTQVANPALTLDVATPSAAKVADLVGRCPYEVAAKPDCSELKAKAIRVCNEHQANPCMETLIKFQGNGCDPKATAEMKDEAVEYACGLGSWVSCTWLSGRLFQSGNDEKRKRAIDLAQQACQHGEAQGCVNLSGMIAWWNGRGMPRPEDHEAAMAWAKEGCKLGSMSGCKDYALDLLQTQRPADTNEARKLLEDSCAKNFEPSCATLAGQEMLGAFGTPNPERAVSLWRKSCACGETQGCLGMAHVFFERNDKASALAITKHACEAGSYDACAALGKLFRDGAWVERDAKQARIYFERACRQNEQESCAALKKMSVE